MVDATETCSGRLVSPAIVSALSAIPGTSNVPAGSSLSEKPLLSSLCGLCQSSIRTVQRLFCECKSEL